MRYTIFSKTLFMIIILAMPSMSAAKLFDNLGERLEEKRKDTKKRIKKELDRTDRDIKKFTDKSKIKTKNTWEKHKDDIIAVAVAATALYIGDTYLTTLALKKYGIINENGKIEWRIILPDTIMTPSDQVGRSGSESSNQMIVLQPDQNHTGVIDDQYMYHSIHQWYKPKSIECFFCNF